MHYKTWVGACWLCLTLPGTAGCVERLLTDDLPEHDELAIPGDPCDDDADCASTHSCFEQTCVGTGDLRVSLSWSRVTDLDLHVVTPTGVEISYLDPWHAFGQLDVDDCVAGDCRDDDGAHVENVFFEPDAPRGSYSIFVANFDGRRDAAWDLEVAGDVSGRWSGELPGDRDAQSEIIEIVWP